MAPTATRLCRIGQRISPLFRHAAFERHGCGNVGAIGGAVAANGKACGHPAPLALARSDQRAIARELRHVIDLPMRWGRPPLGGPVDRPQSLEI
jgi:hypothetical protein